MRFQGIINQNLDNKEEKRIFKHSSNKRFKIIIGNDDLEFVMIMFCKITYTSLVIRK